MSSAAFLFALVALVGSLFPLVTAPAWTTSGAVLHGAIVVYLWCAAAALFAMHRLHSRKAERFPLFASLEPKPAGYLLLALMLAGLWMIGLVYAISQVGTPGPRSDVWVTVVNVLGCVAAGGFSAGVLLNRAFRRFGLPRGIAVVGHLGFLLIGGMLLAISGRRLTPDSGPQALVSMLGLTLLSDWIGWLPSFGSTFRKPTGTTSAPAKV